MVQLNYSRKSMVFEDGVVLGPPDTALDGRLRMSPTVSLYFLILYRNPKFRKSYKKPIITFKGRNNETYTR